MSHALHHRLVSPTQFAMLPAEDRLRPLGGLFMGQTALTHASAMPLQQLVAPLLAPEQTGLYELWFSTSPSQFDSAQGIRYGFDGHLLYGVIDVNETAFADLAGEQASALRHASADAYRRIFDLLDRSGYPHLWRTWNYLTDINGEDCGLERYRQFNIGRHQAFRTSGRLTAGNVPAACALGIASGPLSVAFMAGRSAPQALENPRQMAAYEYPADYGPCSPTFARATLARLPGQEFLFVSGTASILGHASVHVGDVAAQTRETLANIDTIVDEANRQSPLSPNTPAWNRGELVYRVYIRHTADFDQVRDVLEQTLGRTAEAVFVQADVCRAELLVEIEAFASRTSD